MSSAAVASSTAAAASPFAAAAASSAARPSADVPSSIVGTAAEEEVEVDVDLFSLDLASAMEILCQKHDDESKKKIAEAQKKQWDFYSLHGRTYRPDLRTIRAVPPTDPSCSFWRYCGAYNLDLSLPNGFEHFSAHDGGSDNTPY